MTSVMYHGDTLHCCASNAYLFMRGGTNTIRIFVDVYDQELWHCVDPMLLLRVLAATALGLAFKIEVRHRQGRLDGAFGISTWFCAKNFFCVAFLLGILAAITQ